jgi:hypothetical protein
MDTNLFPGDVGRDIPSRLPPSLRRNRKPAVVDAEPVAAPVSAIAFLMFSS